MKETRSLHLWHYSRHFYAVSAILLAVCFQALWPAAVLFTAYGLDLFVGMKTRQNTQKTPKPYRTPFNSDLTVIDLLEPEYDSEVSKQEKSAAPVLLLEGKKEQPDVEQDFIKTREGSAAEQLKSAPKTMVEEQKCTPHDPEPKGITPQEWGEAIQLFRLNKLNLYGGGQAVGEHAKTLVEPMSLILENEEE